MRKTKTGEAEKRLDQELGDDLQEGHEPLEEAPPERCEADVDQTDFPPGFAERPPEGSEYEAMEEVAEAYMPAPIVMVPSPEDGLPVPAGESSRLAEAPPFTIESFVCVADERVYVERFTDELTREAELHTQTIVPSDLVTYRSGEIRFAARQRYDSAGLERERRMFRPEVVEVRYGVKVAPLPEEHELKERLATRGGLADVKFFVPVRPIRERCVHYARQVFNHDGIAEHEPGHYLKFPVCQAKRSVGGAYMSLRDQAIYGCDLRSPADPKSVEQHLDGPERRRLQMVTERAPLFGIK